MLEDPALVKFLKDTATRDTARVLCFIASSEVRTGGPERAEARLLESLAMRHHLERRMQ